MSPCSGCFCPAHEKYNKGPWLDVYASPEAAPETSVCVQLVATGGIPKVSLEEKANGGGAETGQ